jgi:non-specific serine/threonine protein kinase
MNTVQAQPWMESLSSRELEVLQLISNGLSNREIAQELYLSIETVKWYNKQMFIKLGVKSRMQAAIKAAELNLLGSGQDFPPTEKETITGNLPAQLTSYVGREKEIGEIKDLLKSNRLVILTGAGGSGKTRLALKVAEGLRGVYSDGVWLVELSNVRDPSLVLQTIAKVLNIREGLDATMEEALKRFLSRRHLLLLIDNLEHLLACAPFIGELLATAPQLSVLGTSREQLHIYGEQEYPVHPLNLPDLIGNRTKEKIEDIESIALFIKRARAVHPTLSLDDESLGELARICIRLDGLPLAIELCAPMVKVFPIKVIANRIEKSLDTIPSGPRDLPARQQTLRDTIQWSCDLLEANEKLLFKRLAVFNGGGTLQAVEKICGDGITGNVGNILSSLVNKNLVLAREQGDGEIHFEMLETIRQYGREKLLDSGEAEEIADRHAEYFMNLVKQGAVELRGPDQIIWTDRFITMHDNIRAALEWVTETGEVEDALHFVNDLFEFWLRHSVYEEARQWHSRILILPGSWQYPEAYLEAINHLTWVHWLQTKSKEARSLAERALVLSRSQTSKFDTAVALLNLGLTLLNGNDDKAQDYLEKAKDICQENQYEWELARAHLLLGIAHKNQKQYISARSHLLEAFNLWKKLEDIGFQCVAQRFVGDLEIEQGNLKEAMNSYCESLLIAREVKHRWITAGIIWGLANVAKAKGYYHRALRLYLVSKKIYDDIGAWRRGNDPVLEGALETVRTELGELETVRTELGEAEVQSAFEDVQHMTMEEAIEFALEDADGVG